MGTNSDYKDHNQQQLRKSWETQDRLAGRTTGCFPADAVVRTPAGDTPIVELTRGSWIVSVNARNGEMSYRRVIEKKSYPNGRLYQVSFVDGTREVMVTGRHSFLTARGWIQAQRLVAGDRVLQPRGQVAIVSDVVRTNTVAPVYNLITEGEHTFIVNNCVVHNYTFLRGLRSWLTSILHEDIIPHDAPLRAEP